MTQAEFEILLSILENSLEESGLAKEGYRSLKKEKILIHDLGIFKKNRIEELMSDKIALHKQKIQESRSEGDNILYKNLIRYPEDKVRQVMITTDNYAYQIILSTNLKELIGILRTADMNREKDLEYQMELKKIGHPNKDIFMFEHGSFSKRVL
jgi:hypothetical protein